MSTYICDSNHPDSISEEMEEEIIQQAEQHCWDWYYDLGDVIGQPNPINLLIVEDGQ